MKRIVPFLLVLLAFGPWLDFATSQQAAKEPPIKDLEGGWVLNQAWHGYMGVAIQFHSNGRFDYWFYSDVIDKNEPKYPISGKWKWDEGVLQLESKHRLHDTRWYVHQHNGATCLLPDYAMKWQEADGKPHDDRLLFRVAKFDPKQPFENRR